MKQIALFPDYYADEAGIIYSMKFGKVRQLKPSSDKDGYKQVNLCMNGKQKTKLVHQLVAECFIGPRPEGLVVDHIDRNKTNNNASNLRYATISENTLNSSVNKAGNSNTGEKFICWNSKTNKFGVHARIKGKCKYFGSYSNLSEAIDKRNQIVNTFGLSC